MGIDKVFASPFPLFHFKHVLHTLKIHEFEEPPQSQYKLLDLNNTFLKDDEVLDHQDIKIEKKRKKQAIVSHPVNQK